MKKIIIAYWHDRIKELPWEHNSVHEYSKELRESVIDECISKSYSVMIRPMIKSVGGWEHDGEMIWIDKYRFGQR